jgi:hypothetical protein
LRSFRLHLASTGAHAPKINATVSALRFFFNVTLDRPELAKHLSFMHEPREVLLGHAKFETTALYTRVATNTIREIMSPLGHLTPLTPKNIEPGTRRRVE